jgi:succinate dehydrogenase/fumarate reductase flavoprotein subunit
MSAEPKMTAQIDCDLLVIGSGAGGLSAEVTAAWHDLKMMWRRKSPCSAAPRLVWAASISWASCGTCGSVTELSVTG